MGIYLNSLAAYTLYKNESKKTYFVDKTSILEELFPLVEEGNHNRTQDCADCKGDDNR